MKNGVAELLERERELVALYVQLTGASESMARGVFMHVCCGEGEAASLPEGNGSDVLWQEDPARFSFDRSFEPADGWLGKASTVPAGG
jgi:hypothetical protein